jgi:hypothetical protein
VTRQLHPPRRLVAKWQEHAELFSPDDPGSYVTTQHGLWYAIRRAKNIESSIKYYMTKKIQKL